RPGTGCATTTRTTSAEPSPGCSRRRVGSCQTIIYGIDNYCCDMVPFQRVSSSKRRAAMGSPTAMHFRVRENSEKQRAASLLFLPPVARKPRISTANERPLGVNFRPEQLKQRKAHGMHASLWKL